MRSLVLFGTGDVAQLANYYFSRDTDFKVVGFTVDGAFVKEDRFEDLPVIPFEDIARIHPSSNCAMHIALSYSQMNRLRESKYMAAKELGYTLPSYVSPNCTYLSQYPTGDNCFIFEDNTVQPFVRIGSNVILWSGNHIGHHTIIEDHNFVSSHVVVSGHCHIESHCFLGVNSTLAHKVRIATGTLIGAGAVISKDTEPNGVYVPPRAVKLEKTSDQFSL